jgi:hypothetical protein
MIGIQAAFLQQLLNIRQRQQTLTTTGHGHQAGDE